MSDFASVDEIVSGAMRAWKPPPRLSLSEWADRYFYLSAESSAEAGRWKTLPYQRGMMDAITDPAVEQVSVMKSARVGYTKSCVNAPIGYYMHQDPCSLLVVQPTDQDAKGYSKEEVAPMLRDCPELSRIVLEDAEDAGPRDGGNTILHKTYPGGVLSIVGAHSGAGFRRISRRVVLFDEADGYPPSAGSDGDQIKLGIARTQTFWNRKIVAGSTPLIAGMSRIERLFAQGDQRRYFVPCPSCGHMAPLVFSGDAGHAMKWPEGRPEDAFFACQANGCIIEHRQKREMVERGEWRAAKPFAGHASFHIWTAYSYSPNATWGQVAAEFLEAKDSTEMLRTFVNTVLGETWKERGEAPDWQRLYDRREQYAPCTVPPGALVLTCGVDVQKDRWVYEVVAWGAGKESWSVDKGVIPGDTANDAEWAKLDDLLDREYPTAAGGVMGIRYLAVDSGYQTNTVYNWARRHTGRVIATKGVASAKTLLGAPTPVDVKANGVRIARGCKVWIVGTDVAKAELYGWLRLERPTEGQPFPPGWCHFPEWGEDYFKQLTAEHLVTSKDKRGYIHQEWQLKAGHENHWLDARVYARAAATLAGLDRLRAPRAPAPAAPATAPAPPPSRPAPAPVAPPRRPPPQRCPGGFLGGRDSFWGRGR